MSAEGTIFYSHSGTSSRLAFEGLLRALKLEEDNVKPVHHSQRKPVRFWCSRDDKSWLSDIARAHGVAESTIYRAIFSIGMRELESKMTSRSSVRLDSCEGLYE